MTCTKCNNETVGHFKVERINRTGATEATAVLCSVPCLLGWGYDFAQMAGVRLAVGVKQKIDNAKSTIESIKQFFKG